MKTVLSTNSKERLIEMVKDYFYCTTDVKLLDDGYVARFVANKYVNYKGFKWREKKGRYQFVRV